jgi:hypothetical protein
MFSRPARDAKLRLPTAGDGKAKASSSSAPPDPERDFLRQQPAANVNKYLPGIETNRCRSHFK